MKKILLVFLFLLVAATAIHSQNFLDIYWKGKIVSSVKAADVDSMLISTDKDRRMLNFYQNGELFHRTLTVNVDSIKVCKAEQEPVVYLGILGFNQELFEKQFGVLDDNSAIDYKIFVSRLSRNDGTLLYYGVDNALDMLKNASFNTQVSSVNLITFTDGLDQGSLMMNSSYTTDEQYLNAINKRIKDMKVKNMPITAYSLGLRGSDVSDYSLFQHNLQKLASSSNKAFEVNSMDEVRTRLEEISNQIISIGNKQTISMKIPGQSNETVVRFTFDDSSASNSSLYIEGTFNLSDRSLRNVTYHGIKSESGNIVQGTQEGIFVTYTFKGLQREDSNGLLSVDNIRFYYKSPTATIWQQNSEFTPSNNTQTTITHSGAVIMLVLDCSNSLGSQFSEMQGYANDFINRVTNNTVVFIQRPFGNSYSATCKEVIDGPNSKTYRVTGTVKQIVSTIYGNWYLQDETGEIYIYGTLDSKGQAKNFLSWGLEVGDEITVEGPKTTYNGTVELVDVTVVDINKQLISINSLSTTDPLPAEGGEVIVYLTCKGNGVSVEIPDAAKSWLSVSHIENGAYPIVTLLAKPNGGEDRNTQVIFKTSDGTKDYSTKTTIAQKGGYGEIIDVNIGDFISAAQDNTLYRLTGIITSLYPGDKQGKSFYITDYSGKVLIYRADGFPESGAKIGDVVSVVGQRSAYKETPQMGNSTFEKLIHSVTEVSIAEFLTKEDNPDVFYRVSGILDEIANPTYGNVYLKDGDLRLYVYGCYPGWGATGDARKYCLENEEIEVGDKLTVIGYKSTYRENPQITNGIYFSHEKAE